MKIDEENLKEFIDYFNIKSISSTTDGHSDDVTIVITKDSFAGLLHEHTWSVRKDLQEWEEGIAREKSQAVKDAYANYELLMNLAKNA